MLFPSCSIFVNYFYINKFVSDHEEWVFPLNEIIFRSFWFIHTCSQQLQTFPVVMWPQHVAVLPLRAVCVRPLQELHRGLLRWDIHVSTNSLSRLLSLKLKLRLRETMELNVKSSGIVSYLLPIKNRDDPSCLEMCDTGLQTVKQQTAKVIINTMKNVLLAGS